MNLHGVDPSTILSALRLVLDGWKTYRSQHDRKEREQEERVLEEAVKNAEKSSAAGADAETIVAEVGARLERELGTAAKDDILARVSSVLAASRPLDLRAFRYYENLRNASEACRTFCMGSNIFQLRGQTVRGIEYLFMPKFSSAIKDLLNREPHAFGNVMRRPDRLDFKIVVVRSYLASTTSEVLTDFHLNFRIAEPIGGYSSEGSNLTLSLTEGTQVNRIGFHVERHSDNIFPADFDVLLYGPEFQRLLTSLFEDVSAYVSELSAEERTFKDSLAPALDDALRALSKPGQI